MNYNVHCASLAGNPFHHSKQVISYVEDVSLRLDEVGFYHFNDVYKDCEIYDKKGFCTDWYELMGLGSAAEAPRCYGTYCCAQFATSRDRIRLRSLETWKALLQKVIDEGMMNV